MVIENEMIKRATNKAIVIKGKTTDSQGMALPGVTVKVKGSQVSAATDNNGYFKINVPNGQSVLVFSFIGFQTREVAINNHTAISVQLKEGNNALNEVVVVSYGTQSRTDVTGYIAHLNVTKVKDMPVGQLAKQLQGKFENNRISSTYDYYNKIIGQQVGLQIYKARLLLSNACSDNNSDKIITCNN